MGILASTFSRLFRVGSAVHGAVVVGTDDQALPPPQATSEKPIQRRPGGGFNAFGSQYDDYRRRITSIRDYDMIDSNVPELSKALSIKAGNAVNGDPGEDDYFKLEFAPGFPEQDQLIVNQLVYNRLALHTHAYSILRNTLKYGDFFGEVVFDKQGLIWKLKYLEPGMTQRLHDEFDRHVGFLFKGYAEQDQMLEWWQVVHLRNDPEYGALYGRSMFAGGGVALAYRILAIRDSLAYEVLNHATARNAIIFGLPERWSPSQEQQFVEDMSDQLARDPAVDSNGVLSRRAISMLNGQDSVLTYRLNQDGRGVAPVIAPLRNAPVMDIARIAEHFQDLLFCVTGVPKAFLGVERGKEGLGSNRLQMQDLQFARQLRHAQLDVAWFVGEVIRRQFILLGRPLAEDAVTVVMPDLRNVDEKIRAETMYLRGQAAVQAKNAGMPKQFIWVDIMNDGEVHTAEEKAELYGYDPTAEDPPPPPAATQFLPGQQPPQNPDDKSAKAAEQLAAGLGLIRAASRAARGVRVPVNGVHPHT